jgi:hypothetical protein
VNGVSSIGSEVISIESNADALLSHGWWMWTTWCLCGWLMIATKRYMKKGWLISQACHSLIGTYITIITLVMTFKQLKKVNFEMAAVTVHNFLGLFTFALALFVYGTGALGGFLGRFNIGTKRWAHHADPHVRIWAAHTYLARVNVFGGFIACSAGIEAYQHLYGDAKDTLLGKPNTAFFLLWTIFAEVAYRIWMYRSKNE